jgi:hypothetical protein
VAGLSFVIPSEAYSIRSFAANRASGPIAAPQDSRQNARFVIYCVLVTLALYERIGTDGQGNGRGT